MPPPDERPGDTAPIAATADAGQTRTRGSGGRPDGERQVAAGRDRPPESYAARLEVPAGVMAHLVHDGWADGEIDAASRVGSIGVALRSQKAAAVRVGDSSRTLRRAIDTASVGLCGQEPIVWVSAPCPSDTVEITATAEVRTEIADAMGVPSAADLRDLYGWSDPVVLAIALRVRSACRGWLHLAELEQETLIRAAYGHVLRSRFGGRLDRRPTALSARRLDRVVGYIDAHLDGRLSIATLADCVALSPFHFARSFAAATGLAPHRFVTVMRMNRAEERLRHSAQSVADIANAAGYSNLGHFRQAFRAHTGRVPSALRAGRRQQDPDCPEG